MRNEVKENDIVKRTSPAGTELLARVRWVNEKGEAGVTYLEPGSYKGSAQVVDVEELEVVRRNIGEELKYASTEELKAAITRLRSMRMPKKLATRKASTRKKSVRSKLDALLAEGGSALDGLIAKAVEELREEEKGGDN